jgi:hypothetical protein
VEMRLLQALPRIHSRVYLGHSLLKPLRGRIDVYNTETSNKFLGKEKRTLEENIHRMGFPFHTFPSLSTVYSFEYSFRGSLISENASSRGYCLLLKVFDVEFTAGKLLIQT